MIYVILDNVRSLYNVGSVLRTCDGFGVDKIYLCGLTGTPEKEEVKKTALGAESSVEWEYIGDIEDLILKLKQDSFDIVSIEKNDQSIDIGSVEWGDKTALIFGNEIVGVQKKILNMSDKIVHIPMKGIKESFNVASCAAMVIYDVVSGKQQKH